MKKLFLTLMIFALCGTQNLISEENKETDDSYWYRNDVEFNGMILNVYYAKTSKQFLNTCFNTMENELNISFNKFDVKKMYNSFISAEGIKNNYPKTYKKLLQQPKSNNNSAFSHEGGFDYIWFGVPISEYDYMIVVYRNLNGTEYISFCMYLYGTCSYTHDTLQSFERIL